LSSSLPLRAFFFFCLRILIAPSRPELAAASNARTKHRKSTLSQGASTLAVAVAIAVLALLTTLPPLFFFVPCTVSFNGGAAEARTEPACMPRAHEADCGTGVQVKREEKKGERACGSISMEAHRAREEKRARREIRSLPPLLGALLLLPLFSRGVRRASHALITEAISDRI